MPQLSAIVVRQAPPEEGLDPSCVIDALGGTNTVAAMVNVRPPSVSEWRRKGIPGDKLVLLAARYEKKTGFRRWQLRPADWHEIWPELVGSPGAPDAPELSTQARQSEQELAEHAG